MSVSLVSTIYNDAHSVRDCIESLLPEMNEGVEWVFVDAMSDDGTWEILQEYAKKPRFTVVRTEIGGGRVNRGAGRRLAAALAVGDALLTIDTDFIFFPGTIEKVCAAFDDGGHSPLAGDGYFIILTKDYWQAGGYPPLHVGEDMGMYERVRAAGLPFRTKVLHIVKEHRNPGKEDQAHYD